MSNFNLFEELNKKPEKPINPSKAVFNFIKLITKKILISLFYKTIDVSILYLLIKLFNLF